MIITRKFLVASAIAWFSIIAPAWTMECKQPTAADGATQTTTDYTPLHKAAYLGCLECICELTDAGADLNARTTQHGGLTPLHLAVIQWKITAVITLIALGADPTITSDDNKTPLDLALPSQQTELRAAIQHGLESRAVVQRQTEQMQHDQYKVNESGARKS